MSEIAKLYDLQKIDSMFDQVRRRLLEIQKLRAENDDLVAARQSVAETETALSEGRTRQQDTEMQAQSLDERIKESDASLMSGETSNPKELQALQDNLDQLRKQKDTADEHAVNALLQAESLRQQLERQQEELKEAEGTWRADQGNLNEEELALKRKYVLIKKHREAGARAYSGGHAGEVRRRAQAQKRHRRRAGNGRHLRRLQHAAPHRHHRHGEQQRRPALHLPQLRADFVRGVVGEISNW